MDGVIGQTDKTYLKNLSDYNKILAQRNALLKFFAQNRTFDADTLDIYNQQMTELAHPIFEKRMAFMEVFLPIFAKRYYSISQGAEEVDVQYQSDLSKKKIIRFIGSKLRER